jgi:hypothetical protein
MVDATPTAKTALLLLIFGAIVLMATASDYGENHPTAEENSQSNQVNNANNHHGSGSDATAVAEDDVQNGGDGAFLDSDEEIGREEGIYLIKHK